MAGLASCITDGRHESGEDMVKAGDMFPYFETTMADGREISTTELGGKVSVIVFSIPRVLTVAVSFRSCRKCMRRLLVRRTLCS